MDKVVDLMKELDVKADGDLNYILFKLCLTHTPKNYNSIKNFIGELNECVTEIRRRILAPYENEKEDINGKIK